MFAARNAEIKHEKQLEAQLAKQRQTTRDALAVQHAANTRRLRQGSAN
jgi:hypothetical protein